MNIIETTKNYIIKKSQEYKDNSSDSYDFWNEHIKYVLSESSILAKKYGADMEVVQLGALLHDIALICKVGERKDHHINGEILAKNFLEKNMYDKEKQKKVLNCIRSHRSSKNATSIEEICVADADILAHFDNIPMLFNSAFNRSGATLNNVRVLMRKSFKKDFDDLSRQTKELFAEKYKTICDIVLGTDKNMI